MEHGSGTRRIVKIKEFKVGDYSDSSGTLHTMGSPSPLIGHDTRTTIRMPEYFFNIAGAERPVTEVCAEYLALLTQMVDQYKADTPGVTARPCPAVPIRSEKPPRPATCDPLDA